MRLDHKRTDKFKKKKKKETILHTLYYTIFRIRIFVYSLEFLIMRFGDKRTSFQKKETILKTLFLE